MPSRILPFTNESIAKAARAVGSGKLIVFPTDTVYGIGCDPFDADAVAKVYRAKVRDNRPLPVLCASFEKASELVNLGPLGSILAKKFWPGALTIVAPLRKEVPGNLHQGTGNLGVRVPDSPLCLRLLSACGGYLVGTSANISGDPPFTTAEEAEHQLGPHVEFLLDGGLLSGRGSTVAQVVADEVVILRSGPVRVPDEMMRRRTSS